MITNDKKDTEDIDDIYIMDDIDDINYLENYYHHKYLYIRKKYYEKSDYERIKLDIIINIPGLNNISIEFLDCKKYIKLYKEYYPGEWMLWKV